MVRLLVLLVPSLSIYRSNLLSALLVSRGRTYCKQCNVAVRDGSSQSDAASTASDTSTIFTQSKEKASVPKKQPYVYCRLRKRAGSCRPAVPTRTSSRLETTFDSTGATTTCPMPPPLQRLRLGEWLPHVWMFTQPPPSLSIHSTLFSLIRFPSGHSPAFILSISIFSRPPHGHLDE